MAASAPAIRSASVWHFELHGRDVDGDPDVVRPGGRLGAGGPQHPFAELVDQAGILGHRNEFGGRDHAAFGMAPAQQRLAAGDLVAREIDQRLVVDLEAAVGQRLAQILLHGQPRLGAGVHRRFEEAMGAAPAGLGAAYIARSALLIS